ncbi:MAG TPA: sialate O-acetylesterase [Chitinophagaceae bacterium]|nr:sialate O-acetylesterase [Chitinophagaceae bacterium]
MALLSNPLKRFLSIGAALFFLMVQGTCLSAQDLRLPDIFSDNMVLQQNDTVALWGWGGPGARIKVWNSWNQDTVRTLSDSYANWRLVLKTPAAGGPYTLTIQGAGSSVVIHNILIGEDWLCSGQSNMEFSASWKTLVNWKEDTAQAQFPRIRFFHVQRMTSNYPETEVRGRWEECTPSSMFWFSSVGYFFGRMLSEKLQVPVGLIESAWGGTPVETWMPDSIFSSDPVLSASAQLLHPAPWCPMVPAVCFNAMINPLIHFPIAGTIWYQGETNTGNPGTYERAFSKMIGCWRNLWGKDFPFYFVQIAPFNYGIGDSGALVREAQLATYRTVPRTGMVVITDITSDTNNIHPTDKVDVGERLALWALANDYGNRGITFSGPLYRSMEIQGRRIRVSFDFAGSGLKVTSKEVTGLWIAGMDRKFYPAQSRLQDSVLVAWSAKVPQPVALRFGFSNTATPDLFNQEGLPASPFRTDDWPIP